MNQRYCHSLTEYNRNRTRVVNIGDIPLGGDNPIRIQSMTTTDSMNTNETVEQSIRMINAGCEYVRITAPSINEANNLRNIKDELKKRGYTAPIIADIHFTPNAAEIAARIVEKVRINPGNYADKKKFNYIEYSDAQYNNEIERIYNRFSPLIKICKEYGTAMRIGTNHGSLSDRILSRYGDTPKGMVESAMEFLRICVSEKYFNIVLSMKASNPIVMVQANRLLVNSMNQEGMNFPIHIGVTEAGDGQNGRIKSALGIGALLEDGIGDTIRVSLTEDPELELPVAKVLADRYKTRPNHSQIKTINKNPINPFEYSRRLTRNVLNIGGDNVPRVFSDGSHLDKISRKSLEEYGYSYFKKEDKWGIGDFSSDYIFIGDQIVEFDFPGTLAFIQNYHTWINHKQENVYPIIDLRQYLKATALHPKLNFIRINTQDVNGNIIKEINQDGTAVLVLDTDNNHGMADQRRAFIELCESECNVPVIIIRKYHNDIKLEQLQLYAATDLGGLMVDGFGDGVWIISEDFSNSAYINKISYDILQASRTRISQTEYISCPSCGRTLFDLQEVTNRIRLKTEHLKGLKIGIMGCIVNGPGEMADADYGYVGSGVGKISLYKKQNLIKKDIDAKVADEALIELIKENGDWINP